MGYVVVAPVAVVRMSDGKTQYVYQGGAVPDEVPAEELERLAARGLLKKADGPGDAKPSPRKSAAKDDGGSGG